MIDLSQSFAFLLLVSLAQSAPNLNYPYGQQQVAYSLVPQTLSYNTVNGGLGNVFSLPPPVPLQVIPSASQAHFQNDDLQLAEYIYNQLNEFTNSFKSDPNNNIAPPTVSNTVTYSQPSNPPVTPPPFGNIRITYHGDTGTSTQYVSPHSAISGAAQAPQYFHTDNSHRHQQQQQQQQYNNDTRWEHHSAIVLANPTPPSTHLTPQAHYQVPREQRTVMPPGRGSVPDPHFELVPSMLAPEESKRLQETLNAGDKGHLSHNSITGGQTQQSGMHRPSTNYGHAILPPIRYDDNTHSVEYYPMGTQSGQERGTLGGNSGSNPSVYYKTSNSISYPSMILKNSDNVDIHYPSLQVGGGKEPSFEHNAYAAALMTGVQWQNQQGSGALKRPQVHHHQQLNQVEVNRPSPPRSNSTKQENRSVRAKQNSVSGYYEKNASTEPSSQIMKSIGFEVMSSPDPNQKYRYSNGYDGKRQVQEKQASKYYTNWNPVNATKSKGVNDTIVGVRKPGQSPRPPKMLSNSGKSSYQQFSESRPRPSVAYRNTNAPFQGNAKASHRLRGHYSGHRLTESKKRKRQGFTQHLARYFQKFRSMHGRNFNRHNKPMKKLQRAWTSMGKSSKRAV